MDPNIIAHHIDNTRTNDVLIESDVDFKSMFISQNCLDGLDKCGFQKPSPIQLKAIPLGRCGFDLIVKSKSGTGKTLVFSLLALECLDLSLSSLQVLVLAPTREIAVQIADTLKTIGGSFSGLQVNYFIGGFPEKDDVDKAKNSHIAVGAPGRIKSLIEKKILDVNSVKLFVLDEADKLMEKSFLQDINDIYRSLPQKKQIVATSATYPDNLDEILSKYMQCPTFVSSENNTQLLLGLKHFIKEVDYIPNKTQQIKLKNEELHKLLSNISFTQCIIFSNFQTCAENASLSLNRNGWETMAISAAQTQQKRLETMEKLKTFKCRILLSTDLTARGIDASNVDLVINYDIPFDVSTYLHRMGRAGRYGSKGICISLVAGENDLHQMRKYLGNIGGSNLTISKLGTLENGQNDLWSEDESKFEKITGIIQGDEDSINIIKSEVLSLKNLDKNSQSENKEANTSNVEQSSACIEEKNKPDEKKVFSDCLESLAKGTFDFESVPGPSNIFSEKEISSIEKPVHISYIPSPLEDKKKKENTKSPLKNKNRKEKAKSLNKNVNNATLKSLAEGNFDFNKIQGPDNVIETLSAEDYPKETVHCFMKLTENSLSKDPEKKKRILSYLPVEGKCSKTRKSSALDAENHCKISKNEVFVENKGEYEVARVNTSPPLNANKEETIINNIDDCFKLAVESFSMAKNDPQNSDTNPAIEGYNPFNLFSQSYLNTIDKENTPWNQVFSKASPQDDINENEQMEITYHEDDQYEVEDDQQEVEYDENGYENIPNRMVWVPVEEGSQISNRNPQVNLLSDDNQFEVEYDENEYEYDGNECEYQPEGEYDENGYENIPNRMVWVPIDADQGSNRNPQVNAGRYRNNTRYEAVCEHSGNEPHHDVLSGLNLDIDPELDKHFSHCFLACKSELFHKMQTTKTTVEFGNWFTMNWERRLKEVRHYVEKNIYVNEMSSYMSQRHNN